MKKILLGIAFLLLGVVVGVSKLVSQYDLFLAICWGLGLIGIILALCGYFSKSDGDKN